MIEEVLIALSREISELLDKMETRAQPSVASRLAAHANTVKDSEQQYIDELTQLEWRLGMGIEYLEKQEEVT